MSVAIYEVTNAVTTWVWLCGPCVDARRAKGWTIKAPAPLPDGSRCTDCDLARQSAPDYVTPTVAYAPPRPESHLPAPELVTTMPGVAPMKRWSEYMAEKREAMRKDKAA